MYYNEERAEAYKKKFSAKEKKDRERFKNLLHSKGKTHPLIIDMTESGIIRAFSSPISHKKWRAFYHKDDKTGIETFFIEKII